MLIENCKFIAQSAEAIAAFNEWMARRFLAENVTIRDTLFKDCGFTVLTRNPQSGHNSIRLRTKSSRPPSAKTYGLKTTSSKAGIKPPCA
ncbi:MAG: hypothetical protein ACLUKN_06980 [Bacilli bacterium]